MLNENDSYVLELFDTIYVWQGMHASASEKHNSMAIAKQIVIDNNKPKGTHISRIPQGVEDSLFKSYFEDFYKPVVFKGEDGRTSENQDIAKVAEQEKRAAALTLDKLGGSFSYTLYRLSEDLKTPTEVTGENEKMFVYAEDCYVIDVIGPNHRYILLWTGRRLSGDEMNLASLGIDKLTGSEKSTNITRVTIRKGHEDESFMQFFKHGLIILDGPHQPMAQWRDHVKDKGTMFRI